MTVAAPGEENAIRGVVVLTDGKANEGPTRLDELIQMMSNREIAIKFSGFEDEAPKEVGGRTVNKKEIMGTDLAIETRHPIQIFFIGIGEDSDLQVGRLLAGASGAEYQGVAEKDLAEVLEAFSKYF